MADIGIVAENAQPLGPGQPAEEQPEQHQTIVKTVLSLLSSAKKGNGVYKKDWNPNYEFVFKANQWSKFRPTYRSSEVLNLSYASIMQEVGIQTDSRPKSDFIPQEPSDLDFTEMLKEIHDANWQKYSWSDTVYDGILDAKWCHVAHWIVEWDPELENGLGDQSFQELDPTYCFWDPNAVEIDDCRYFIYAAPVPTSTLKADYPDKKELIKSDISAMATSGGESSEIIKVDQDTGAHASTIRQDSAAELDRFGGEDMTMLIRCWLRDDTLEQKKAEDDNVFELRKKFPGGRYIEIAAGHLLQDGPNGVKMKDGTTVPYEHKKFPIVPVRNYRIPNRYAGENEVTHIRGPQKTVNYLASSILEQIRLVGNPIIKVSPGAGIKDVKKLTNEPGAVWVTNDINAVQREPGTPVPPSHAQALEFQLQMFDRIYGSSETSRGAVPPNVSSGVFFEGVVEAEQTRSRMKGRSLEASLQRAGQLFLANYLQFYTAPRVRRITNKDGFPEFVEFFITEENGQKTANIRSSVVGPDGLEPQEPQQIEIKGVPDVKIATGAALPFQKALKRQAARDDFAAGLIDRTAALEMSDLPNWQEIDRRMQEQEAQAAQAEQGGIANAVK